MSHTCISTHDWTGGSSAPDRRWQSPSWYQIQVQNRGPRYLVSNMSSADQVWRLDGLPSSLALVEVHHRKRAKHADPELR